MSDDKRASGRSRTKIERLTGEEKKEKAAEVFGEGAGDALGDVEAVSLYINKIKSDHDLLKGLHMVLYNRPGTQTQRKAGIRKFNGFVYDDKLTREKVESKLEAKHWTVACLKDLAMFLGLEKSGGKMDLVGRIADFLESPKAGGAKKKAAASPKKKKRKVEAVTAEDDSGSDDEETAKKQKADDEGSADEGDAEDDDADGDDEGGADADNDDGDAENEDAEEDSDGELATDAFILGRDDDEEATLGADDGTKDDDAENEAKDEDAKDEDAKDEDAKGGDAKDEEPRGGDEDINKNDEDEKDAE